jgi:hypothetical protein
MSGDTPSYFNQFRLQDPRAAREMPEELEQLQQLYALIINPHRPYRISTRNIWELLENEGIPTTIKALRYFILCIKIHKTSLEGISTMMQPLDITMRRTRLRTGGLRGNAKDAYFLIMNHLKDAPILPAPDSRKPLHIRCWVTATDMNASAGEQNNEGEIAIIRYASRSLTENDQRNYQTIEKECRTATWALEEFKAFIKQRSRFKLTIEVKTIHTDIFQWIRHRQPRLQRHTKWIDTIRKYRRKMDITYLPSPAAPNHEWGEWSYDGPLYTPLSHRDNDENR